MNTTAIAAIALALSPGLCHTATIYQWRDEEGHIHMADSVPKRYRNAATRIDSRQFEVPKSEQAAANARNARLRERLAALEAQRASAQAAQPLPSGPNSFILYPRIWHSVEPWGTECDRLWQAYFESQECFSPYRMRQGIRASAFACYPPVADPSYRCGPARVFESG